MDVRVAMDRAVTELTARDWLRLNGRAARNVAVAVRADAERAHQRAEAARALGAGRLPGVPDLRRAR